MLPCVNRRSIGPWLIAFLCAAVALVVAVMAAPRKRVIAIAVVSVPFAIGALAAARAALRAKPLDVHAKDEGTIGSYVGDSSQFIAQVPELRATFDAWARQRELKVSTSEELLEAIWRNADDFSSRELILAAIAAYGELVRKETGGDWTISRKLPDREPVVADRRVVLDVLEILSSSTPYEGE